MRGEKLPYFAGKTPRVFAHRGLHTRHPENTVGAFRAALEVGATHIETDVVGSKDGIAVIAHDLDLARIAGRPGRVGDFTATQLADIDLGGEGFVSLDRVLEEFPTARFNIDIKDRAAIPGAVDAIRRHDAQDRVLLASFSSARRRRTVALLGGAVVASAGGVEMLVAHAAGWLSLPPTLHGIHAVQIPERSQGLTLVTPATVARYHAAGIEVHVWTINDPDDARRLVAMGVDGIVTDRCDLIIPALNS